MKPQSIFLTPKNTDLNYSLGNEFGQFVRDLGRIPTADEAAAFTLGFKGGCNAKADEMQPLITELEMNLHGHR